MFLRLYLALASLAGTAGIVSAASGGGLVVDYNTTKVRVQALSRTLVRIEPEGPGGFEDRATFAVVGRDSFENQGDLKLLNQSGDDAWVGNDDFSVHLKLRSSGPAPGPDACLPVTVGNDVLNPSRSKNYPNGAVANDRGDCCSKCEQDTDCTAWVFAGTSVAEDTNCWLLNSFSGFQPSSQREVGCGDATCAGAVSPFDTLEVFLSDGTLAWSSQNDNNEDASGSAAPLNYVSWPAPGSGKTGYAFEDSPRFYAPPWGPTPMPSDAKVDPKLVATNGYDFTNNVKGDMYVFLFPGKTSGGITDLSSWHASRRDFLTLTGPIPLLPDYAYGTWFTYWHQYSFDDAKSNVSRWEAVRKTPFLCAICI